jgi:hypothetical protein
MLLSPLVGIASFQSGVGDQDDLKVQLREDLNGGWFVRLREGFYYIGHNESYLFAQKAYAEDTPASTTAIETITVTGFTEDPTELGPILLRTSTGKSLTRVSSPFRAYQNLTFTVSGDVATAPVSGFVVSVVSDPASGIYLQVPSLADILSVEDYVFDPVANTVKVKDTDPPELFATWLRHEVTGDQLLQHEIVRVDRDGFVRTQLTAVSMASGLVPTIRKPTPTGAIEVEPTAASGNVLTLPTNSGISSGDLVAVEYYAQGTYSAVYSAGTLTVKYLAKEAVEHYLEWETKSTGYYDTSELPESHNDYVQLNPLLERQEPCFLYLCATDLAKPVGTRVTVTLAEQNPVWSAERPEPCLVRVLVEDPEGTRIPKTAVTLTATLAGNPLVSLVAHTDWHGKALFQVTPNASGALVLTATAGAVSGTTTITVHDRAATQDSDELQLGKLLLHLEKTPYRDNLYRVSAYYCHLDGPPFQPHSTVSSSEPWRGSVRFTTRQSTLYTLQGNKLGPSGEALLDVDAVATLLIQPSAGDVLRAEIYSPDGTRRRVARPLRLVSVDTNSAPTLEDA